MKTVMHTRNKRVVPNVGLTVVHAGKNDYRVIIDGVGEHSRHTQYNPAQTKACWLAILDQADLNHEIAKVQNANDALAQAGAA